MKKLVILLLSNFILTYVVSAQETNDTSSRLLQSVIIKAYEGNRKLKEVPAGVNYISPSQLYRYDNSNILSAVNATPGARMEERSPASYRLNIRGSSLRSPFGVRNVKIYWNDIPLTDPGGNTYLNQLSTYNFQNIEIIKGPSGSLYGAGNGGAMLINQNPVINRQGLDINYIAGSFAMYGLNVQMQTGNEKLANAFNVGRMNRDGYRDHTEMRRDIATWQMQLKTSQKNKLVFNFLYGDLYYQTPGGLTLAQYNQDPKASRPATSTLPSAETAKAAIYQTMYLGGITNHFQVSEQFSNTTTIYAEKVDVKNPTFLKYEARDEPHWGGRTDFKWHLSSPNTTIVFGAEMQRGKFNIHSYSNKNGSPGNLLTNDDIKNRNLLLFAQVDLSLNPGLNITVGASSSSYKIGVTRLNVTNPSEQGRTYKNELAPRIAFSKKIVKDIWWYGSVAKGFSPPTRDEVLPSNNVISTSLNAEHGISYESGFKSTWLKEKIYFEAAYFYYHLKDAIVQRRDASNADYFENAGSTKQQGVEWQLQYTIIRNTNKKLNNLSVRVVHSLYNFKYQDFKQINTDFSGKKLPGVPKNTIAALLDASLKAGLYLNVTYYYGDKVALNDANTDFATSYNLFGFRLGWRTQRPHRSNIELFVGGDNLLDVTYSLGNDINAAAGRYYNAAAGRNFFGGISIHFVNKHS